MNYDGMSDEELIEIAKERIVLKEGFRAHLIVYIMVNALLCGVYYTSGSHGHFWPIYPILGWGIGIVGHYLGIRAKLSGTSDRVIQKELEIMKKGR